MGQGTLVSKTIQVLLEVIKETPLKEKLRFVPSYSIGHQVGECLSCSGGIGVAYVHLALRRPDVFSGDGGQKK